MEKETILNIKEGMPRTFGHALKRRRVSLGLTQQETANILNISRSQYWKYENDYITPKIKNMEKISKRLGIEKTILNELRIKAKTYMY
ncbi:MAG: helix-turn-helix transcriptional regulator [Clostridia bacterium]|nr:helix-turn-helix transcriptional regulator [Clostridia bacterium]